MTNCLDALVLLQTVTEAREVRAPSSDVMELRKRGMLEPVLGASGASGIEAARARLSEIAAEMENLRRLLAEMETQYPDEEVQSLPRKVPEYQASRDRLESLEKEQRALRTGFLEMVQKTADAKTSATVNGERLYVTYRGQELLGELLQRRERVRGMVLDEFLNEMESIKAHFEERATRAHQILGRISPAFPTLDEIHFRMAAVGLSARAGDSHETADLFIRAFRAISFELNWEGLVGISLAENLALRSSNMQDLEYHLGKARPILANPVDDPNLKEEQVRSLAIIMACEEDVQKLFWRTQEIAGLHCQQCPSAAAFLVCTDRSHLSAPAPEGGQAGLLQSFIQYSQWMAEWDPDPSAGSMASAVLAATDRPAADVMERFRLAFEMLSRFNGGGMEVPSAMIAILPTGVEESMDNVRIASAAIVRHRLSLGGAETLSLGVKMLVQSSVMATAGAGPRTPGTVPQSILPVTRLGPAPQVLAMPGFSPVTAPALGAGLATFHERSLHRIAVRDYRFHPVHMHYVYG